MVTYMQIGSEKNKCNVFFKNMFWISMYLTSFLTTERDQKTFPFLKILNVNTYSCFRFVEYYLLCPCAFRGNILTRNPFSFSQCISFSQFSFLQLSWLKFLSFSGDKNMAFLNLCHWKYATIFKAQEDFLPKQPIAFQKLVLPLT